MIWHPYRVAHYLQRKENKNKADFDAMEICRSVMPGAFRSRHKRKRKKFSSWDRWANGNQHGSFNSDED